MSEKAKQLHQVLDYLLEHGKIDAWTAIHEMKILRLGARIYDLRKLGYNITTTMIYRKDQETGAMKKWALYSMEE